MSSNTTAASVWMVPNLLACPGFEVSGMLSVVTDEVVGCDVLNAFENTVVQTGLRPRPRVHD